MLWRVARGMQGNGRGNEFPCPGAPVDSVRLDGYLALAGARPRLCAAVPPHPRACSCSSFSFFFFLGLHFSVGALCSGASIPLTLLHFRSVPAAMAGTMSALANCGLMRAPVHHSINSSTTCDTTAAVPTRIALPPVHCSWEGRDSKEVVSTAEAFKNAAFGLLLSFSLATASPSFAANNNQMRLPPLSTDPNRCERAFTGNTIGQANGVADKVLDLRMCDFSNDKTNLKGKTLSAALMSDAKFDGADLTEVIMSKAYAVGASFKGSVFTNAVVDRVAFDKSDMQGVQFINTVLSGSTFEGANLEGASFENALIGYVDIQKLCKNPTLPEESRIDLACRP